MELGKPGLEEAFRSSLADVIAIAEKLSGHCPHTADLIAVCKLALESDAQLRLLLSLGQTRSR